MTNLVFVCHCLFMASALAAYFWDRMA